MKNVSRSILIFTVILSLLISGISCSTPDNVYVIRVTGWRLGDVAPNWQEAGTGPFIKESISFSGSITVTTSKGVTSRSVDGLADENGHEFNIGSADAVSCTFQMTGEEDDWLEVAILKDGKVVNTEYTSVKYGVVSVSTK